MGFIGGTLGGFIILKNLFIPFTKKNYIHHLFFDMNLIFSVEYYYYYKYIAVQQHMDLAFEIKN